MQVQICGFWVVITNEVFFWMSRGAIVWESFVSETRKDPDISNSWQTYWDQGGLGGFGKHPGGSISVSSSIIVLGSVSASDNISDLGFVYLLSHWLIWECNSLTVGLKNLRVIDLTLLCSSRTSLTIAGMNLLLEGLSEPSVKYN